jgi:signal transduction histidine kinase
MPLVVYVVDDDPLVTDSLGTALRLETPYEVETFNSATAALAAMPSRPPEVLITDFKMPGLDGLALLRAVRQGYPDAVLMLLTGYADKESAIRAINEVGIFQYVEKPWDLQDLLLKIQAGLERRDLTLRLRAANADLERRNEELRRSLAELARAHEELRITHDRLLAAERLAAVGRVTSGIAHDIGNQLALVGYAEAIKHKVGGSDREIAEFCDIIAAAQRRLAAMVGEIKDFTRGQGEGALTREPADVSQVVDEALSILRYDPEVASRRVRRDPSSKHPLARVHRGKLAQVIINLVRNAAQASPPDAEITVELDEDSQSRRVKVVVVDRGTGMPAEVLARLGEPFFSTRERGTGLGVGICRRIVAEHEGDLVFESRVGEGTRVTVTLPGLPGPS